MKWIYWNIVLLINTCYENNSQLVHNFEVQGYKVEKSKEIAYFLWQGKTPN